MSIGVILLQERLDCDASESAHNWWTYFSAPHTLLSRINVMLNVQKYQKCLHTYTNLQAETWHLDLQVGLLQCEHACNMHPGVHLNTSVLYCLCDSKCAHCNNLSIIC